MRFSAWPRPQQTVEGVLDLARYAEGAGWDGVWMADHFMPNADDVDPPVVECWSMLAAMAVAVPRVRLGSLVCGNTYRHPAVLANIAATVDHLSGGRLVLGLGAGWQENEHRAYGIDLPPVGERLRRLEEACRVVKGLTTEARTTFSGEHYALVDAPMEPKPVQDPLPLLIGGGGEKVTMRIAATYADEWNVWGTPETLRHKVGVLDRHCEEVGRDPAAIRRSCQALLFLSHDEGHLAKVRGWDIGQATIIGTPQEVVDIVGAYAEAGVDELIVPDFTMRDDAQRLEAFQLFDEEVRPHFT